mgnify:CR=1 FL=1
MIEKNVNVYKKQVTRILNIDPTSKRVNIFDNRFYLLSMLLTKSKYNFLYFFILNLISFVERFVISRIDISTKFLLNFLLSLPIKIES